VSMPSVDLYDDSFVDPDELKMPESPQHRDAANLIEQMAGHPRPPGGSWEFIARTDTDKEIFRLCMQDEARHVSYGTLELKNYLDVQDDPTEALEQLHRFADLGEQIILTALSSPALLEPIAILMGGDLKHIDHGLDGVEILWAVIMDEYLQRCERAGFDRRSRCTLPLELATA